MPRTVTVRGDETRAAALAEALLAEGILREDDWDGRSITSSLGAGITRWAASILGGRDLQRIEIGLQWTDNLQAISGMDVSLWRRTRAKGKGGTWQVPDWSGDWASPAEEPVGLLALQTHHHGELAEWPAQSDVIVGPAVLELEAVRKGLGFQVLALLGDVLPPLIGAAMPHYAWGETRVSGGLEMELKGGRGGVLHVRGTGRTCDDVLAEIPEEAIHGRLRPEVLRKARSLSLSPRHRQIVDQAVDVLGRYQALRTDARACDASILCAPTQNVGFLNPMSAGMAAKLPSFCVRWSRRDLVPDVVESYLRQLNGRGTNLAWCQAWLASDPESIRRAARNWRVVVSLVLRACRLAELLHSESEP